MKNSLYEDGDYKLWLLLHQARDAAFKVRRKELRKFGLSNVEAAVLFFVQVIQGAVTPAKISRCILREPNSVSTLLNRMERKGLVRKVNNLERRNLVRVVITEKGKQAYYQSARRESILRIISALSEEERQQLNSCLNKLVNKAMEELGMGR